MKKVWVSLFSLLLVLLCLTGCNKETYSFRKSVDEIESIEIVSAEDSRHFVVIKTLSEEEKTEFLKQFQTLTFSTYYVGDPMSVYGTAVKFTYQSGDYEILCHDWGEYVNEEGVYGIWKSCDEEEFNALINGFSTTTTTTTTTSTTTTTVPTTTTTAKRLTPQEAVAIVKGKLPPEKASYMHVDCEDEEPIVFDEDRASFSGKECYYIHVYSLSEELLDGDQGPYRQMFTYAWLYVDVQTGEVFQDAPSIDDPEPLVPWPGDETR